MSVLSCCNCGIVYRQQNASHFTLINDEDGIFMLALINCLSH